MHYSIDDISNWVKKSDKFINPLEKKSPAGELTLFYSIGGHRCFSPPQKS